MKYDGFLTGWLAPDGDLYECDIYDHIETAANICHKFGYEQSGALDDILLKHSWVHISFSFAPYRRFYIEWDKFLTEPQKQFLKPYFEEAFVCNSSCLRWKQEVDHDF